MHLYRTHKCNELNTDHVGQTARLSGWINRKRDHGGLLFVDLRDHYGLTQCVIDTDNPLFQEFDSLRNESVITVTGEVIKRTPETINSNLPTGEVELAVKELSVVSKAHTLPLQVNTDEDYGEETRLKYRYLDLRREKMQKQMGLRADIIRSMRDRMHDAGFKEFQTPILTTTSPEGARDFIVPSRLHPGKFFALPQAPQQFKQLLMVSGFDRYFQIAPCFRDEDARADRTAGEFYQLDFEMSFVTQDEVLETIEPIISGIFQEFSTFTGEKKTVTSSPIPRIPYDQAMLKYGTDKPDLRNPLFIVDVSAVFTRDDVEFKAFKAVVEKGGVVRAIRVPNVANQPRSFFDKLNDWARGEGAPGLGYVTFDENMTGKGPIAKFIPESAQKQLIDLADLQAGDAIFFACDKEADAAKLAGKAVTKIGTELGLIDESQFAFCWIVDFPMYEQADDGSIDFSHNPFSMPHGGMDDLQNKDPLEIKAYLYDFVCNGYELASGAIRNHSPEIMAKAFEIAGYPREELERQFSGMLNAFKYGAPVHGGAAFGIERIVMLLADKNFVREVVAFPLNQSAQDVMMGGPLEQDPKILKELSIKLDLPKKDLKKAG